MNILSVHCSEKTHSSMNQSLFRIYIFDVMCQAVISALTQTLRPAAPSCGDQMTLQLDLSSSSFEHLYSHILGFFFFCSLNTLVLPDKPLFQITMSTTCFFNITMEGEENKPVAHEEHSAPLQTGQLHVRPNRQQLTVQCIHVYNGRAQVDYSRVDLQ